MIDADNTIDDAQILRDAVGEVTPLAKDKELPALDEHCRRFIQLSPFLCLGTADAEGNADVSPRGDPPGFVAVLDAMTLLIPERPGNRRIDSMTNIVKNPKVGILFMVPGIEEVLRVNGRASVVNDPALLAPLAVTGKIPALGIRVDIDEVFFHCAKAIKRSKLWDPSLAIERNDFPTYGQIIRDQRMPEKSAEEVEAAIQDNYGTQMY